MSIEITGDSSSYEQAIDAMVVATEKAVNTLVTFESSMQKMNFDQAETEIKDFADSVITSTKSLSGITGEYSKISTKTKTIATGMETYAVQIKDVNKNIKTAVNSSARGFGNVASKLETASSNVKTFSGTVRGVTTRMSGLSTKLKDAKTSANSFAKGLNDALKKNDIVKSLANLTTTINKFTGEIYKSVEGLTAFNKAKGLLNMAKGATGMKAFQKAAKDANKQISIMGVNMTAIIHMAFYRVFIRLTQYIRQSISTVLEFNRALIELQSVSGGGFNLNLLEEDLRSLAQTAGLVKKDITDALYQILSLRYADSGTALGKLNAMVSASVTLNTSLTSVVEVVATAFNNYGNAIGTTDNIMAIFNKTIQLGKVKLGELTNIVGQVLPIAKNLGVGLEEVSAMMDIFTIKGMSAAKAGTQTRGLFLSLIKPTKRLSDAYEQMGIESGKQGIKLYKLGGFLKKLNEHFHGNIGLLSKAIGRQRALNAFVSASANDFAGYDEALKATNASLKDYLSVKKDPSEAMANKFEAAMQRMKNAFESEFTQPFIDAMIALDDTFGPLIATAMSFAKTAMLIGGAIYLWIKFGKVMALVNEKYTTLIVKNKSLLQLKRKIKTIRKAEVADVNLLAVASTKSIKTITKGVKNVRANSVATIKTIRVSAMKTMTAIKSSFIGIPAKAGKAMRAVSSGMVRLQSKVVTSVRIMKVTAMTAIATIGSAMKAMAKQTLIMIAISAIIWAIEKAIALYSSFTVTVEQKNKAIRKSVDATVESLSRLVEINKVRASNESDKVIAGFNREKSAAVEAYDMSLKGAATREDYYKRADKLISAANKSIVKLYSSAVKSSDNAIKKMMADVDKLSNKIKKEALTIKDRLNTFFGKITYEIDVITGKRSLAKAKKDITSIQSDIAKANKDASIKIRRESNKNGSDPAKITEIKTNLAEKVSKYNEQIKALQITIDKSKLFFNKKIPALYSGLNLKETKKYLKQIKVETKDTFATIVAGKDTSDVSNKGLEKQKQLITDLTSLREKLSMSGLSTKNMDTTISKNKADYRIMLQQAKDAKDAMIEIEKEKNKKLHEAQKTYLSAYAKKDVASLTTLRNDTSTPAELKEKITVVIDELKGKEQVQKNWDRIAGINERQASTLERIEELLKEKNTKVLNARDKVQATGNAKIAINNASAKMADSNMRIAFSGAWVKNTALREGQGQGDAAQIISNMLKTGDTGMLRNLTESTSKMIDAMKVLQSMSEGVGDVKSKEAINLISKAISDLYQANKKTGDIVETPTADKEASVGKKGKGKTVDLVIKDQRQSELVVNLDGQTLARQIITVFQDMPNIKLNA